MKALLDGNLVVDVQEVEFEVHPNLVWVDCPDHIETRKYTYENGEFTLLPQFGQYLLSEEESLLQLRKVRNDLLLATDYWGNSDMPAMTQEQIDYRQALRDITETYQRIEDVVWPVKP